MFLGLVKWVGIQTWAAGMSFLWMVTFDEGWWKRDEIREDLSSLQAEKEREREMEGP